MSLIFVGLGIHGALGLPFGAIGDLRSCDRLLLDSYTNPIDAAAALRDLSGILDRDDITLADRGMLEDIPGIVSLASGGCLGILVPGDVFVATTHEAIRQEALRRGVPVKVWHSSSIVTAALERVGLHLYKLGFVGTLVKGPPQTSYRVYFGVNRALLNGQHSVILLEYDASTGDYMDVGEASKLLIDAERSWRMGTFSDNRPMLVFSRLYGEGESMSLVRLSEAGSREFGGPPYTLVVPGPLHYSEEESLRLVLGEELLKDVGFRPLSPCERAARSAIDKTRAALPRFRTALKGDTRTSELLENVECYMGDAERFLVEGRVELAVAEASYAEGLLDALRLLGFADVSW